MIDEIFICRDFDEIETVDVYDYKLGDWLVKNGCYVVGIGENYTTFEKDFYFDEIYKKYEETHNDNLTIKIFVL